MKDQGCREVVNEHSAVIPVQDFLVLFCSSLRKMKPSKSSFPPFAFSLKIHPRSPRRSVALQSGHIQMSHQIIKAHVPQRQLLVLLRQ